MDVPRARRIEVPTWVNARTVLGAALFLVSFLGAQRVLQAPPEGVPVWVVSTSIPAGETIGDGDLATERIDLPRPQLEKYVLAGTDVAGAVALRDLAPGELVPLSAVGSVPDPALSHRVTIPVEATHAVGGRLRPGDRIDVYGTFETERRARETVLVASDVLVHGLVTAGGFVGEEAAIGVTVAVSDTEAERIVSAIRRAEIDLVQRLSSSGGDA